MEEGQSVGFRCSESETLYGVVHVLIMYTPRLRLGLEEASLGHVILD